MKKILPLIIIIFILLANVLPLAAAGEKDIKTLFNSSLEETAKETGHLNTKISNAGALGSLGLIIQALLSLIGIIFLFLMIYGGFIWMNARGDDQAVTKAKSIIKNSLIGLVIVMAAYAITNFVGNNLVKEFAK